MTMNLTLDRSVLLPALRTVAAATGKSVPVASHVQLRASGDTVAATCTDMDMWLSTSVAAAGDPGAVCVPVDPLLRFVDSLPDGSQVALSTTDAQITVRCGRSRASFGTLPADVFPMPGQESGDSVTVSLPAADLKRLLSRTVDAVASEIKGDVVYALAGLHLTGKDNLMIAEACDGKVMMRQSVVCDAEVPSTVLSSKTVRAITRILPDSGEVLVSFARAWIAVSVGKTTLRSKLIEVKYPSLDGNIKAPCGTTVTMKTAALKSALDRMEMLAKDKYRAVRLVIDGGVQMTASDGEDFVEAEVNGPALEIGMNVQCFARLVAPVGADEIRFGVVDGKRAIIVRDGNWVGAASALVG